MKKRESGDITLRKRGVRIYREAAGWFVQYPQSESPLVKVLELENPPCGPFSSALDANNAARLVCGLKQKPKVKTPAQRKKEQAHYDRIFREIYE